MYATSCCVIVTRSESFFQEVWKQSADGSRVDAQGLLVKMITGDQALIGRETAKQLGMGSNIFNTEVLLKVGHVPLHSEADHEISSCNAAATFASLLPLHMLLMCSFCRQTCQHDVQVAGQCVI